MGRKKLQRSEKRVEPVTPKAPAVADQGYDMAVVSGVPADVAQTVVDALTVLIETVLRAHGGGSQITFTPPTRSPGRPTPVVEDDGMGDGGDDPDAIDGDGADDLNNDDDWNLDDPDPPPPPAPVKRGPGRPPKAR